MEYFAALPGDRLAAELEGRVNAYYQWILVTGRLSRWRIAFDTYYGQRGAHNASYITPAGDKGELSLLMSNEYRNLVQHLLVMAFQSKTAFEMVSTNTDSTSKAQTYIAKGIVEYNRRDGRVSDNEKEATEIALIMDTGWVFNEWNFLVGEEVDVDRMTGQPIRQGDFNSRARTPLDVIIDFTKPQGTERDWIMVRDPANKFDLAAQYPELAEELTGLQRDYTRDALFRFGELFQYEVGFTSPDIDIWTFYHRKSPAMPQGRIFQFVNPRVIIPGDGPLPYKKLPGNRICPTEQILSCLGYSNANSILALQDVMDAMISAATTNMTTCGVNNIWTKPSPNFDFQQLVNGMNLIESDEKPEVLIMNRLPPEWLALANFIIQRMEIQIGMNAVARGNIEGEDLSGAAMALLQSMAIQFNNGLVRAVNKLEEDDANDIIQLSQSFKNQKSIGMIIGENNKYMMREWSKADIDQIQRVYARRSNPLKDTTAGKLQLLDKYMEIPGMITSSDQINEVIETGSLDSSTELGRNKRLLIDQENEAMIMGEVPPVLFCDNHPEHMLRHSMPLASPDDRKDPELIERIRAHNEAHKMEWMNADPAVLMAHGIPPFPGMGMLPPGGGPMDGAPPPEGMPIGGPSEPGQALGPSLPTNPLSGEQWNPETGGLPQVTA